MLCTHPPHCMQVIKNGQMLGVRERRSRNEVSSGSLSAALLKSEANTKAAAGSMSVIGEVPLFNFYNDGGKGTGTAQEMALEVGGCGPCTLLTAKQALMCCADC
jgi:hypothetical protein